VGDAGTQESLGAAESLKRTGDIANQDGAVGGLAVGQLGLGPAPHTLGRVELGCVGGEVLETKARVAVEQRPDQRSAVDVGAVEEHEDGTAKMTKQVTQEGYNMGRAEVLVQLAAKVEPAATSAGAEGEGGKHRDTVVLLPVSKQGRLAAWRPGAPLTRRQLESRLVKEDDVGAQPRGVFFTRGQSRFFQRSIATSSRSSARRSGF
jgi:hypothetical protein